MIDRGHYACLFAKTMAQIANALVVPVSQIEVFLLVLNVREVFAFDQVNRFFPTNPPSPTTEETDCSETIVFKPQDASDVRLDDVPHEEDLSHFQEILYEEKIVNQEKVVTEVRFLSSFAFGKCLLYDRMFERFKLKDFTVDLLSVTFDNSIEEGYRTVKSSFPAGPSFKISFFNTKKLFV